MGLLMNVVTKDIGAVLINPDVIEELCQQEQVVALARAGEPSLVLLSVDLFNEIVGLANQAETYQALWQSEVDCRQGNMLSADDAIAELNRLKKLRGTYKNGCE